MTPPARASPAQKIVENKVYSSNLGIYMARILSAACMVAIQVHFKISRAMRLRSIDIGFLQGR